MTPRKRRSSPWPLAGLSLVLLLLPAGLSQKTRLTALAGFNPFRSLGTAATGRRGRFAPVSAKSEELHTRVDFLNDQVRRLENENKVLQSQVDQASGLKQPARDLNFRLLHADVLFPADGSPWRKSLTLALGTGAGVEKGMLVLYNNQVVGRIIETSPWSCRVQAVTDPGFRARAVAAPRTYSQGVSFSERQVGVYEGTSGSSGQLKWLTGDAAVEHEAFVLTTDDPENGVPRGLILGRVSAVNAGRGRFPKVDVDPILNLQNLERVTILLPPVREKKT